MSKIESLKKLYYSETKNLEGSAKIRGVLFRKGYYYEIYGI